MQQCGRHRSWSLTRRTGGSAPAVRGDSLGAAAEEEEEEDDDEDDASTTLRSISPTTQRWACGTPFSPLSRSSGHFRSHSPFTFLQRYTTSFSTTSELRHSAITQYG